MKDGEVLNAIHDVMMKGDGGRSEATTLATVATITSAWRARNRADARLEEVCSRASGMTANVF